MAKYPVNACTDITGFGLLGHLKEMVNGSNATAELYASKIPVIEGVIDLVTGNVIPGGTKNNLEFIKDIVDWDATVSETEKIILADAQTSGGLLISLPHELSEQFLSELHANGVKEAIVIGRFTITGSRISVLK
jgi:selenophosphate synthase